MKTLTWIIFIVLTLTWPLSSCTAHHDTMRSPAAKLHSTLVQGGFVLPEYYGATGDGNVDDTEALRTALFQSCKIKKPLYLSAGKKYLVSGPINYYQGKYQNYTINIIGSFPLMSSYGKDSQSGGIIMKARSELFKNCTIRGSIERVRFQGLRNLEVKFFDHCTCDRLIMYGCNVVNFGVMFADSPIKNVSQLSYNQFLSVFYFSKNTNTSSGCTDSRISNNYINGGMEQADNNCFEWASYNGSNVQDNFIDYYRTIYQPNATQKLRFVGPHSSGNQYQVFRYLYAPGNNIGTMTFFSYGDSFNWTEPSALDKLKSYKSLQYVGKDGKMYDYPPYIARCQAAWQIKFVAAKIERHVGSVVFLESGLTEYPDNYFDVEFVEATSNNTIRVKEGSSQPYYNGGKYLHNHVDIKGLVFRADVLPPFSMGWTSVVPGVRYQVGNKQLCPQNCLVNGKWVIKWVEE